MQQNMQQHRKKGESMVAEASGVYEKSDKGESAVKVAGKGEIFLGCLFWEQYGKDKDRTMA